MLDYLIKGGTVIDGTGSPGRRGRRRHPRRTHRGRGRTGQIDEEATETVDATGLVVCPGFVDPHTHYDAQLFWDPQATPQQPARGHLDRGRQLRLHAGPGAPGQHRATCST